MNAVSRARRVGIAVAAIFPIIAGLVEVVVDFKGSYLLCLVFLGAEMLGRIYLVMAGIAPSEGGGAVKIVTGGVMAFPVILYAWSQLKDFDCGHVV